MAPLPAGCHPPPLVCSFFFFFCIFDTAGPFCSSSTTWPITQGGPTGPGLPLLCARASPPRAKAASNGGCADRERLNTKGWVERNVGPAGGWDREGGQHFLKGGDIKKNDLENGEIFLG